MLEMIKKLNGVGFKIAHKAEVSSDEDMRSSMRGLRVNEIDLIKTERQQNK